MLITIGKQSSCDLNTGSLLMIVNFILDTWCEIHVAYVA